MANQKKAKIQEREFESFEFVPFACHYSANTLLTKNGELVQIIKIPNNGGLNDTDFRNSIVDIINRHVQPEKFAIWVHTLRTRQKIENISPSDFNSYVDYLWKTALPSSLKYRNCIYITVLRDATPINHLHPLNYLRSLSLKFESSHRNSLLTKNELELNDLTNSMLGELSKFGAELLSVYEEHGTYYSAQMEFIAKTLHFNEVRFELQLTDLSRQVVPVGLVFNNYTGVYTFVSNHNRFHGAVISFKEAYNISAMALQDLLNSDTEMVISQSLDFAFGNKYISSLERQKYVAGITSDRELANILRFGNDLQSNIVLQQTNIIIAQDSPAELARALKEVKETLTDLGIICYTEDIRAERAFWAALPGNFSFMRRQTSVRRNEIGTFACFGNDKFTAVDDCFFGVPVTFFEDAEGSPYALHFLNSGQSNTLAISPDEESRIMLCNLLASQSAIHGAKIIYYDRYGKYSDFVNNIGGTYLDTLDFERIRSLLTGEKTIIIINSLEQILQSETGHEFFANFADTVNDMNAVLVSAADYTDNCEALLPTFRTQIFCGGQIEPHANNFDIFEDEIDIISYLGEDNLYLKEGYNELVLKFRPPEKLVRTLLTGRTS